MRKRGGRGKRERRKRLTCDVGYLEMRTIRKFFFVLFFVFLFFLFALQRPG
jgi:hypothetical protein